MLKLLTGAQARYSDGDLFFSPGLGARYFPCSWLNASVYFPYHWNTGEDDQTGREVDLHGPGDLSMAASLDVLELADPSMIRVRCPQTGGPILALTDDEDLIKHPHLTFTAGMTVPTGKDDFQERWWFYPAQYQPGAGVVTAYATAYYAQGIGPVTPGAGISYLFGGVENSAGYDRPDSLVYTAGIGWLFWSERFGRLQAAAYVLHPLASGEIDGEALDGSDRVMVLIDLGASVWAFSFWNGSRKFVTGLNLTLPLLEGDDETEPRNGFGLGVFCTFGF